MQVSWEPLFTSRWALLAITAGLVALLVMVQPAGELSQARRRVLFWLRCIAASALLLTLLRPTLVQTDDAPAPATLTVLLDRSRSMALSAGDGNDRQSVQRNVWNELAPVLQGSDDATLEVQVLLYDQEVQAIDLAGSAARLEEPADGEATDVAVGLKAALARAAGRPLAGVVLVGDGTQTADVAGAGAQAVARTLASLEVPLWTVPIGPPAEADGGRDVEVDGVPESQRVFAGNRFAINATIRTRALTGRDIPVRVRLMPQASPGAAEPEEIAVRSIVPKQPSDVAAMEIPLRAPEPGRYRVEVAADPQPGEALTLNNRQIMFLEVREGGGRILYLEGEPRQEQLRLRRALGRFPDLELEYVWVRRDRANRWPVELGNLLEENRFDIFVLGDLHADALGTEQLQQITDRVGEGAGLLVIGGFQTLGPGGYADSPLASVMPVTMDASLARPPTADPPEASRLEGPLPLRVVTAHPLLQLSRGQTPQETFDRLRPMLGASRIRGVKAMPGVDVLLETPQQDPLLVIGEFGRGRAAVFAADSTWQWWRQGESDVHRRFWRQLMLWLLSRDSFDDNALLVELDQRRFDRRQPPPFRVRATIADRPLKADAISVEVVDDAGNATSVPFNPRPDQEGMASFGGTLPELPPGLYRLRASAEGLQRDELAFQVMDRDIERMRPVADPAFLRQLSALTADAGGASFNPDQVDRLIDAIQENRSQAVSPIVQKYRLGDDPISGWFLFVIFAAAMITQWALRRRWGLA